MFIAFVIVNILEVTVSLVFIDLEIRVIDVSGGRFVSVNTNF